MNSVSYGIFKIFSILASLVNPVITILIGILLTRVEEVLLTINPKLEVIPNNLPRQRTVKLVKLIGTLMVIAGVLSLIDNIFDFSRYLLNMVNVMF